MREIKEEEDLLEEIRNRTWSVVKLGVKGEIECTKMLIAETGLPRPKAKGRLYVVCCCLLSSVICCCVSRYSTEGH